MSRERLVFLVRSVVTVVDRRRRRSHGTYVFLANSWLPCD